MAVELGADWRQIAVEPGAVSAHYANLPLAARWSALWMPVLPALGSTPGAPMTGRWARGERFMATADGTSIAAYEGAVRHAAASLRTLLAMAAADRWDVDWQACDLRDGFVINGGSRLSFGQLADAAAAITPPDDPELRGEPARERPGRPETSAAGKFPRLDLPAKVDGSYLFAGDVRLPGMLHAAIRHGPIGETVLANFDKAKARGISGLVSLVKGGSWLAAVAKDWWAAERALAAIAPTFHAEARAGSDRIEAQLDEALLKGEGQSLYENGDADNLAEKPYALRCAMTLRQPCMPRWKPPAPRCALRIPGWSCGWQRRRQRPRCALPPKLPTCRKAGSCSIRCLRAAVSTADWSTITPSKPWPLPKPWASPCN